MPVPSTPPGSSTAFLPAEAVTDTSGPRPGAKQLVRIDVEFTYFCSTAGTKSAAAAVYDDGTVMVADTVGAWCTPTPTVRLAAVDPTLVAARIDELLDTPGIDGPLDTQPSTDLAFSVITVPGDQQATELRVYSLDSPDRDFPASEVGPRRAVRAFVNAVTALADHGPVWIPDRVVVASVWGEYPLKPSAVPRWPIPVTPRLRPVLESPPGYDNLGCVVIDGSDAGKVWKAQAGRLTDNAWRVGTSVRRFAVGIVLPGDKGCVRGL